MQGLSIAAITATEKHTLMLDDIKSQSHSSAKSKSRLTSHSACLKSMSRIITMQGVTLASVTASKKRTLMLTSA